MTCGSSTTLVGIDQHSDGVTVTVQPTDRAWASQHMRARYVVGADGARSSVRALLGIELESLGSEGNHLGVLFRADLSSVVPAVPHALTLVVSPGAEGMVVPTGEPGRWIYDIEWHPNNGETLADWPTQRMVERIQAAIRTASAAARDPRHVPVGLRRGRRSVDSSWAGSSSSATRLTARRHAGPLA